MRRLRRRLFVLFACLIFQVPLVSQAQSNEALTAVDFLPDAQVSGISQTNEECKDTRLLSSLLLFFDKDIEYASKIVDAAVRYSYQDFPKAEDILAIITVESRFNQKSRFKGSVGLMQINLSQNKKLVQNDPYDVDENIRVGSSILRTYYLELGSKRAAVMAYNSGDAAYLRGRRQASYFKKYVKALSQFKS